MTSAAVGAAFERVSNASESLGVDDVSRTSA